MVSTNNGVHGLVQTISIGALVPDSIAPNMASAEGR